MTTYTDHFLSIDTEADAHVSGRHVVVSIDDNGPGGNCSKFFLRTFEQADTIEQAFRQARQLLAELAWDDHASHDDRSANLSCRYCWPILTDAERRAQVEAAQ